MEKVVTLTCLHCSATFERTIRTRGRYHAYCSEGCRKAGNAKLKTESRIRCRERKQHLARHCLICGTGFSTVSALALTCGAKCRAVLGDQLRQAKGRSRSPVVCECWNIGTKGPPGRLSRKAAPRHPDLFDVD